MKAYRLYTVAPRLVQFIENLTNIYVRFNRNRLKGKGGERDALFALCTLYDVLLTLCKAMAPFTPFLTETIFQNLRKAQPGLPRSVHFCDFPEPDTSAFDARIERSVGRMNTIIELARSIREKHAKPVKTPLRRLVVVHPDKDFLNDISGDLAKYVEEEVNVRQLEVCSDASVYSTTRGEPNWSTLGKRLGKALGGVTKAIKAMDGAALAAYEREGKVVLEGQELGPGDIAIVREFRKPEGAPPCDAAGDGDVLVVLEVSVDDELVEAGVAREVVNRVQKARKAAGLQAADLIEVFWSSADEAPGRIFQARPRFCCRSPPAPAFSCRRGRVGSLAHV